MEAAEAKRVISLVETVRNLKKTIEAIEAGASIVTKLSETEFLIGLEPFLILPHNTYFMGTSSIVDLGDNNYQVGRVVVRHEGGIKYTVGDGVPVIAFSNGTWKIWDSKVDSEGNNID